ncbi:MAG: L-serine ammonia-lyase, iron-sulfur-dependent, subunit alpha [Dysgonamonadaceae bacterium]|nr:L-serine ammonia-lyase, iron-sulfur-dependent, subunit alpha [Dysgonamonadaceae bacterium]
MSIIERKSIKELMQSEITPAIGCTEPVAVALCVAKATEILGCQPERIDVFLSANVLKNAMGVGIPGTGMTGLPIAIALGALVGKSEYGLEALRDVTPADVETGKRYIAERRIKIDLKENIADKLYIEAQCLAEDQTAVVVIRGSHTRFSFIEKNGDVLLDEAVQDSSDKGTDVQLTFRKVFEYATETPVEELRFILDAAKMNREAAKKARQQNYGHNVGKSLIGERGRSLFGDNPHSRMLSATAVACDARMDGALIPVMSNSGSGNQGVAATLPVITYAEEWGCSETDLIRALILSNLSVIYIKQHLGRLSALCGCVVAASGSSCGITYLMGGDYNRITFAIKNMIANITGMICDGAKPSCALKIASGTSTAILSALMAMENEVVTSQEGIVDDDVDKTILNLALIGKQGMAETDKIVLDVMTHKE